MSNTVVIIRNAAPQDFGGGERFPVFLASALRANHWQPIIISRSKKLLRFAHANTIPSHRGWWWSRQNWSGKRNLLLPLYIIWQAALFAYYIVLFLRLNPSVVHIQSKDDFIAATFAGRLLGKNVIWTDHADLKHVWRNHKVWYKNFIGKLVYLAASSAHAITVVSQSERQLISANLAADSAISKKLTVIYNGAFDQLTKFSTQKASRSDHINFIIASRLVVDKGIKEAVAAFTALREKYPHIRLTVIGDGPDADSFATLPGAQHITFLGHVDNPLQHLAQADVFIHPTYHEGFSVALVEAAMMGLPTVATSVGGNLEIISDRKTGLLVPAKNSMALANAMELLITDTSLRTKISRAARAQFLDRFEFNGIVQKEFLPLYKRSSHEN